jgi:hypothetical protein
MFGASWPQVLDACHVGAGWEWRQLYEDLAPWIRPLPPGGSTQEGWAAMPTLPLLI